MRRSAVEAVVDLPGSATQTAAEAAVAAPTAGTELGATRLPTAPRPAGERPTVSARAVQAEPLPRAEPAGGVGADRSSQANTQGEPSRDARSFEAARLRAPVRSGTATETLMGNTGLPPSPGTAVPAPDHPAESDRPPQPGLRPAASPADSIRRGESIDDGGDGARLVAPAPVITHSGERGGSRESDDDPVIQVSIGRVDVRATLLPEPPKPPRRRRQPTLTLDDYLARFEARS